MAKNNEEKKTIVAQLKEKFRAAKGIIFTDYKGLTVAEDTKLRFKMRAAGSEYRVIKNTMARIATNEIGLKELNSIFKGTTAVAIFHTDSITPAKIIKEVISTNKNYKIKGGIIEGQYVNPDTIKAIADLPSRKELMLKLCITMQVPISSIIIALHDNLKKVAYVLNAVCDKKQIV